MEKEAFLIQFENRLLKSGDSKRL